MSYSSDIYKSVSSILDSRKKNAEYSAEKRREELYNVVPELKQIDYKISRNYASIAFSSHNEEEKQEFQNEIQKLNQEKIELINKLGYPENYLDPEYHCKKCNDTGRISGFLCDCYKELCLDEALKDLYKNSEAEKCSFKNFDLSLYPDNGLNDGTNPSRKMKNIYEYCLKYSENFSTASDSLILIGKTGLGKTHLSLAIAAEAVKKGYGVIYSPIQKIISDIEDDHFKNNSNAVLENFCNCDLLIIDDLGAEFCTQFSITTIGNIVNERLVKSLPTIISSNLSGEELIQKYSERTASRILGKYRILFFVGDDIRFKNKY